MATSQRSYLDYNATAPMRPEVAAEMARAFLLPGNASSVHAEGRAARAEMETARERVAALVGALPKNVIFTSGGTEANNFVLSPSLHHAGRPGASLLLCGATEHPSVLGGHRFAMDAVERIPVDSNGIVDLSWLKTRLENAGNGPVLVSVQVANNETGVLQPVAAIAALVREHGGYFHADAVQAAGKILLDMPTLGVDALTLSAHKIGGPKGIGAVVLASDRIQIADRLIRGGGQERGYRAGTENVAAMVGFGVAAKMAKANLSDETQRLRALRDEAEARLLQILPEAAIFGAGAERLPNTLAFAIPGVRAETALIAFDMGGVALSSGSACSSGKVKRSHVLDAMSVEPALAEGALRVSLGWMTTKEDVARFAETCERLVSTLYKRKANAA